MSLEFYDGIAADVLKKISLRTKRKRDDVEGEENKQDEGPFYFRCLGLTKSHFPLEAIEVNSEEGSLESEEELQPEAKKARLDNDPAGTGKEEASLEEGDANDDDLVVSDDDHVSDDPEDDSEDNNNNKKKKQHQQQKSPAPKKVAKTPAKKSGADANKTTGKGSGKTTGKSIEQKKVK